MASKKLKEGSTVYKDSVVLLSIQAEPDENALDEWKDRRDNARRLAKILAKKIAEKYAVCRWATAQGANSADTPKGNMCWFIVARKSHRGGQLKKLM